MQVINAINVLSIFRIPTGIVGNASHKSDLENTKIRERI